MATTATRAAATSSMAISSIASVDGLAVPSNTLTNSFNAAVDLDTLFGGYAKIGETPQQAGLAMRQACEASCSADRHQRHQRRSVCLRPAALTASLLLALWRSCRPHCLPPRDEAVPGNQDAHRQVGSAV